MCVDFKTTLIISNTSVSSHWLGGGNGTSVIRENRLARRSKVKLKTLGWVHGLCFMLCSGGETFSGDTADSLIHSTERHRLIYLALSGAICFSAGTMTVKNQEADWRRQRISKTPRGFTSRSNSVEQFLHYFECSVFVSGLEKSFIMLIKSRNKIC